MANAASGGTANAMPGCGTPGWLTEDFGWDAFRISGAAGGVGICHPSTWTSAAAASQVTLTRSDATTITTIIISSGGDTYANTLEILTDCGPSAHGPKVGSRTPGQQRRLPAPYSQLQRMSSFAPCGV